MNKAGPRLQLALVRYLPTNLGLGQISVDELCDMSGRLLRQLLERSDSSAEITAVIQRMSETPGHFPEEALTALRSKEEHDRKYPAEERIKFEKFKAVDRSEVMLDTVISLQASVTALTEQLEELKASLFKKKRLFG